MEKRSSEFYVKTDSKVVQTIGKSYVMQPQICFKGGSIKWYKDTYKKEPDKTDLQDYLCGQYRKKAEIYDEEEYKSSKIKRCYQ